LNTKNKQEEKAATKSQVVEALKKEMGYQSSSSVCCAVCYHFMPNLHDIGTLGQCGRNCVDFDTPVTANCEEFQVKPEE